MHKSFVLYNLFMSRLLHLDSSHRDLAVDPVPHLDGIALSAQFTAPSDHTPEQDAAHALTQALIGEVIAADTVLIGLPLYNFGMADALAAIDALVEV
jgi:FMN-dependent NADH-azoreductase